MNTCPACRREVQDGLTECSFCGVIFAKWRGQKPPSPAKFSPTATLSATKPCPACQRDLAGVRIMDRRCSYCGAALPQGFDAEPDVPPTTERTSKAKSPKPSVSIGAILVSVALIFAGKVAYQKFDEYTTKQKMTKQVEELLAQGPEAAQKEADRRLASASPKNRPKIAASTFYGYYWLHIRGYYNYCQQQSGIDITPFVTTFSDAHSVEYERAKLILARADFGFTEDKLWSLTESLVQRAVARDMSEASRSGARPADICQALNDDAQAIVAEAHFSKANPAAYNVLSTATIPAR